MGESFDYSVVADGTKADATNKQIEDGLHRVGRAAGEAGQAITSGLNTAAVRDAQGNFIGTAVASERLRAHVDELTDSWEREDRVLERIKGPAREFEADLEALNRLHHEGTISAKEHEEELARMQSRMHEESGNPMEGLEGKAGLLKSAITGGAAGAMVGEAKELLSTIGEMIEEHHKLEDSYTNLTNSVQIFRESGVSADATLREQTELAEELHAKVEPTIAMYQRVAANSDKLALSHESQIRLARSLGEAVTLSNKSLEEGSGLMARFGQMMETGNIDTRLMNQTIREAPALVKVWEDAFHESITQITRDTQSGKITTEQLVGALISHGEVLDQQMEKRKKTHEMTKEEIKTQTDQLRIRYDVGYQDALLAAGMEREDQLRQKNIDGTLKFYDAQDAFDEAMKRVNKTIEENTSKAAETSRVLGHDLRDAVVSLPTELNKLDTALGDVARRMGLTKDVWDEGLSPLGRLTKATMEHGAKVGEAKQALETLRKEFAMGTVGVMEYKAQYEQLVTTIEGGLSTWRRLDKEINEPLRNLNDEMHVLQAMFASGAIDFDGFYNRMQKIIKAREDAKAQTPLVPVVSFLSERQGGLPQAATVSGAALTEAADNAERKHLQTMVEGSRATEKFKEELRELDDAQRRNVISVGEHDEMLAKLRARYDDIKTPNDEWARALEVVKEKYDAGMYSADQFARATARVNAQYDHGLGQGITNGLVKVRDEMMDVASVAEKTLVDAFHGIENALVELTTTGQTNWSKMVDSMMNDLARLAIRELEMKLITSLGFGSNLPAHDMGASWTVGGTAGADTSLQAFWASPGETVTVTPAGGGGAARTAQRSGPVIVENHNHFDRRELLSSVRTYDGRVTVMNELRSQPGALKTLLQK